MKTFLVALVLVSLTLGSGSSLAGPSARRGPSEFASFPLWKDVPGRSFAKLAEGYLRNGSRWAAFASRVGSGRRGRETPCVTVARISRHGRYGTAHECGPLAPRSSEEPPVMALMTYAEEQSGETNLAMSFQTSVRSIIVTSSAGKSYRWHTHLLNSAQRSKGHLPPLRYVATSLEEAICPLRISGYGADGEALFEVATHECDSSTG